MLRRSTGELTYFAPDIAYHEDKLERGYDRADQRARAPTTTATWSACYAAWEALGGDPGALEIVIMQLVNLLEGGERAQMSKRAGRRS